MKIDYSKLERESRKKIHERDRDALNAEALLFFTERFVSYELCYSEETGFLDINSMERISDNMFLATLRRDYLTHSKGGLRGKELDKVVRIFMEQAKKYLSVMMTSEDYKDFVREVTI